MSACVYCGILTDHTETDLDTGEVFAICESCLASELEKHEVQE